MTRMIDRRSMTAVAAPSAPEQPSGADVVRSYLRAPDADPGAVRAAIEGLSEDELQGFQFDAFHMNLLGALRHTRSPEEIRRVAAEAARRRLWRGWEFTRYLLETRDHGIGSRLDGWEEVPLRELLDEGRGVVVCSHHMGDYRHLAPDLSIAGHFFHLLLDHSAFRQTSAVLERCRSCVLREGHRLVNVEDRAGLVTAARALKRGGTLVAYVDGNTGPGGPLDRQSVVEISFFGLTVAVKAGIARLAAKYRTPILPVLVGPDGRVHWSEPIRPSPDDPAFEGRALQAVYSFLEDSISARPAEWENWCFLHRWRPGPSPDRSDPAALAESVAELERLVEDGMGLMFDPSRVTVLRRASESICTDVETLHSYRMPSLECAAIDALTRNGGLRRHWFKAQPEVLRIATLRFLAPLWRQGAISVCE